MEQKTYGVYGLMEWVCIIKMGKKQFRIPFTDGISTSQGTIPATYTTSNPIVQLAIESSIHYSNKRIKLLKTLNLGGDKKAEPKKEEVKKVAVSCVDDAKDYLSENTGINRAKLKNKEAIKKVSEENGIIFEGI